MAISNKDALNRSNLNTLAPLLRGAKIGDIIGGLVPTTTTLTGLTTNTVHVHTVTGTILSVAVGAVNQVIVGPGTTLAAGEVSIAYDADGLATLTFFATTTLYATQQNEIGTGLGVFLATDTGS